MNRFERVDAVHTNDSILALFEESRTLSRLKSMVKKIQLHKIFSFS